MSQQRKVIKIPGGDAFIEIAESYIRIGVGDRVYLTLDEKTINGGASNLNWEMDPGSVTYYNVVKQASSLVGMLPATPAYFITKKPMKGMMRVAKSVATVSAAIAI